MVILFIQIYVVNQFFIPLKLDLTYYLTFIIFTKKLNFPHLYI